MAAPETQEGKDKQRKHLIRNYPAAAKKYYGKGSPYGELTKDEIRNRITKKSKHEALESKKKEAGEHKTVTTKQHKKIMKEQGTENYGKY